jgi:hypothetical protein
MGTVSTLPPNTLVDYILSHWNYVQQRIAVLNPNRLFGGIVEARDWPFKLATLNAFYMETGMVRTSPRVQSWQGPCLTCAVRWEWCIPGTDTTQGTASANRYDRFQQNQTMQTELLNGLFPGFCPKSKFSVTDNGQGSPLIIASVFAESLWWTKPNFAEKIDSTTGVLFGFASVNVSSFAPEINS